MDPITEVYFVSDKGEYATFVLVTKDNYNMLAIDSSFGGFVHAWHNIGDKHFHSFLARHLNTDGHYLAKKFCIDDMDPIDWRQTSLNIRQEILDARRAGECTKEQAKEAWPESLFESESDYSLGDIHQTWFSECEIVTKPSPRKNQFLGLHKYLWPLFIAQLVYLMIFKIGDTVIKKENAGFVGEKLTCFIPDVPENHDAPPCFLCNDSGCLEYPTLWVMVDGEYDGSVYHVSECQLSRPQL